RWIRTVPIMPGNEARIVGFKTGTEQRGIADRKMFKEQHAAIPDRRTFPFETGEVFAYLRTANGGKFPGKRHRRNLGAIQVENLATASIARHHVQVSLESCTQVVTTVIF